MKFPSNIVAALDDPRFFGPMFAGESWNNWKAVLRGAFGLQMSEPEREFFRTVAGREPPNHRVRELDIIAGRRSGKDAAMSAVAAFAAVTFKPSGKIRPGERPLVMLLGADRAQARSLLGYIKGYFSEIAPFKALVQRETLDGLELINGIDIVVSTADYRSTRGRTVLLAILNEVSFWPAETSATPDVETFRAVQPALATLDGESMLIMISSAYRRQGLLYDRWSRFYGTDDPNTLVIHARTSDLNPTISLEVIEAALADDKESASAEWLSLWRDDLAGYITRIEIEAIVDRGITTRPPRSGLQYQAHLDASSGSGKDSFCCALGHKEGESCIIDHLIEIKPPFSPPDAVSQIAAVLKSYSITRASADRWGLGFVENEFRRHGIELDYSEKTSSELFRQALPIISSGRARLVDNDRMITQFTSLERRILPGGGERIAHPERGNHHDDVAVVIAGCLVALSTALSGADGWIEYYRRLSEEAWGGGDIPPANSEFDDIRVGNGQPWRFTTDADYVQIRVPEQCRSWGRIDIDGAPHCFHHGEGAPYIDVLRNKAADFLRHSNPIWKTTQSAELLRQLGLEEAA